MQIIPICFTFDNNFVIPGAVALYSLLEYANKQYFYKLYILHTDITDKSQNQLHKAIDCYSDYSSLEFINVKKYHENLNWSSLKSKQHYSKEIYNKLILDQLFPQYNRILCSDVDVIFKGDISASFFMFPNDTFYVAGIKSMTNNDITDWYGDKFTPHECEILKDGIGAGYILLNLEQIRKDKIGFTMCTTYQENLHRLIQPEQDVINLCCYPKINYMPYNIMVCTYYYSKRTEKMHFRADVNLQEILNTPVQVHYAGYEKPWNNPFCRKSGMWFKTLKDVGLVCEYLKKQPFYLKHRIKRYNIARFLSKLQSIFVNQ